MTHDCLPLRLGAFDRVREGTKCRRAPHSSSHLCTPEKFDRGAEAAVTMRNPDFCYELDDFMLPSPSHRPTHHSDTLRLYARAIHDTCACLAPMASRRCSSLCFQVRGLTKKKCLASIDPVWFTIPRRCACSTRLAICEVAQLRAARAIWTGRTSPGTEPFLRPRGENPEIRVERTSCVVVIHQKGILAPGQPIVHGGARADIAGPLTLTGRCWHLSGATEDELVPER